MLGTDGFGRSDTRQSLRRYFEVDAENIVVAALHTLTDQGLVERKYIGAAIRKYKLDPDKPNPVHN